ncbi:MAG TPA: FtsX-like permease family protein [Rhodothermales bacterium]|nr:FtsX-like permease family protein [Rhodothermales bacterium]
MLVGGRIEYVRIFLFVALFVILIASINFMNLATARSTQRAKEIGVRKSVGATKSILARQFLGESLVIAGISFVAAMILVAAALPTFNSVTDKSVGLELLDPKYWLLFAGIAAVTGLLAGSYPALYLSSFNVISVLRSRIGRVGTAAGLRKGLVVFQFVMSIVLIVGTFTVYEQLNHIRSMDLGLDRDNVVYLDFEGAIKDQYDSFAQELRAQPAIVDLATSNQNPLRIGNNTISVQWQGKDPADNTLYSIISTGYGLVETMNIRMAGGRTFSKEFGSDSASFVINETAAAAMGMDDPVGQALTLWGTEGEIVGVMKDFNMTTLYRPIEPVILRFDPDRTDILYVRIAAHQTGDALAGLEHVYSKFNPEYPFEYRFLDEEFEDNYRSEIVIGSLANFFAFVALLIACLGLFGLASFTAEQRTKEIGVRKVLGASVASVVTLLSKEFLLLVGAAFVVAAPLSYYLMSDWLSEFEYHADFGTGILLAAGLGAMIVAWLTVSYQSMKVATANPVVALRSE